MVTVAHLRHFRGDFRTAVLIDRSTMWGNPYRVSRAGELHPTLTRAVAIESFRVYWYHPDNTLLRRHARVTLVDCTLLCHCAPAACHGTVIAEYLNDVVRFYRTQEEHARPRPETEPTLS